MADNKVHRVFAYWFREMIINDEISSPTEIMSLSIRPHDHALRYMAYNIKCLHFYTIAWDGGCLTQNSGVFGTFRTRCYANSHDTKIGLGEVENYGKLVDIIKLNYHDHFTMLFLSVIGYT